MDADEYEVYQFLKTSRDVFISPREVCRRAGGKHKFRSDQNWAYPVINRMVERGIIETDESGRLRLKPMPERGKKRKPVSPHIAKILKDSGRDFSDSVVLDNEGEMDSYYENL